VEEIEVIKLPAQKEVTRILKFSSDLQTWGTWKAISIKQIEIQLKKIRNASYEMDFKIFHWYSRVNQLHWLEAMDLENLLYLKCISEQSNLRAYTILNSLTKYLPNQIGLIF